MTEIKIDKEAEGGRRRQALWDGMREGGRRIKDRLSMNEREIGGEREREKILLLRYSN